MALNFFDWQASPGLQAARETYEAQFTWGKREWQIFGGAMISGAARDSGSSPTTLLRAGLLLGKITASGKLTNWSPTATDGSEIVHGVLIQTVKVTDVDGNNQDKFWGIHMGGTVKAAQLINLDRFAREQMHSRYTFDDDLAGLYSGEWRRHSAKTANYTVTAADNGTLFNNTAAVGAVTFTLPTLANGLRFGFHVVADQNITVASAAGDDIVALNDASADSVSVQTAAQKIGALLVFYANPGATKWIVENRGFPGITLTIAT